MQRISDFSLRNFKAFKETVSLPIRPITVLTGLNSHGKSSIIDALLLLKQTLLSEKRTAERRVLLLNGPFFQVDQFEEMLYIGENDSGFTLGFRIPYDTSNKLIPNINFPDSYIQTDFNFSLIDKDRPKIVSRVVLSACLNITQKPFSKIEIHENPDNYDEAVVKVLIASSEVNTDSYSNLFKFSYFLPVWEIDFSKGEVPPKLFSDLFLAYRASFQPAIKTIEQELIYNIKYVGPLREEPQRNYIKRGVIENDVGSRGEDTVLLLRQHWRKKVAFVELPEDESRAVSWETLKTADMELGVAINEALRWMGMQKLEVKENSGIIRADFAALSHEDKWVTIADVGFGVSQILPVLTTALLSDADSLLIFEQPEIHLHPRAQARLAELMICLARTGRRMIIETHSDHLINRLRRIAAEDMSNELADQIGIMFVRQSKDRDGAYIESLKLDKEGLIENWPPGFLAETAEDSRAIIKAGISKRRGERK